MALNFMQAIILGILQGLGEFLPISSTAHLILAPYFFGWNDPGLSFDVALHVGTLIAVVAFFWRDWLEIFKSTSNRVFNTSYELPVASYSSNLLWLLVVASVPGAFFGLLLENKAESVFRNPLLVALALGVAGLVLYLIDKYATHRKDIQHVSITDSIIIGLSQAVAIIPGVSRSGATMAAGLARGLSREQAARFSFLLATPIIFGAAILKVPHLVEAGITVPIILGILAAAISGYMAIKYMLRFVQRFGYAPFFWYRILLALAVAVVYIWR